MRPEKQLLLDDIKERLGASKVFLIAKYTKLNAQQTHDLRGVVRGTGGDFEVIRKRVLSKAAEGAGSSLQSLSLDGHIGVIFGGPDALATTKAVFAFGKESENALEVIGGYFEGSLYDAKQVEMLSKLPSLDQMRAEFLGLLEAPMAEVLSVMQSLLTSVVYCLDNKVKQHQS